ncbi:uncharacterized protein ACNLHF_016492 [Anomaloglossus baeobatrachus]
MIEEEPPLERRMWIHPLVKLRKTHGHFNILYGEMRKFPPKFEAYCHLTMNSFDNILGFVYHRLKHQDTYMRLSISPEERLLVTLRYLATGQSISSLHFEFLLGRSTIGKIILHTCTVMQLPSTQEWMHISEEFLEKTAFPNCIGAIDGKHIRVKKPPNSASRYFNYHKFFYVVILAMVDTNYCFLFADIRAYGSASDARIFRSSRLARRLMSDSLSLPAPKPLPGNNGPIVPFVMVADQGFALSRHLIRPYPRRGLDRSKALFNSKLARAHCYVEHAFGILASRWRIYQTTIQLQPTTVKAVIKATVVLHNYCRLHEINDKHIEELPALNAPFVENGSVRTNVSTSGLQVSNQFTDYVSLNHHSHV